MSRRSPVAIPDFASSPTISTAEATSSVPPGGWTGPRARSASDSNPCLGTAPLSRAGVAARREGPALCCLAVELRHGLAYLRIREDAHLLPLGQQALDLIQLLKLNY